MAGVSLFADPVANLQLVIGPAIVLGLGQAAYIARMGRSSLLEVIREDYVRTARAKGLNSRLVIAMHALPNALLPVITLSGVLLGLVLAGSIPVERAFGTPGLGYAMFTAVSERDVFVMQNLVFLYSVVFVLLNIVVDVTIALLDPEDPLQMSASHDRDLSDRAIAHRRLAHALAAARRRRGSSGARRCRPSGAASPPLIVAMAIAAPAIVPYEPLKSDFRSMQKPPDEKHWFGTDQIGRDTLSRVIYGSRASLTVAFGAVLFGTTVGALWGLACGYFGGRFDMVSQRLIEFLQSFPDLILAMAIAMALGGGLGTVIVAIAITRIPFGGRVIRSVVLSLKEIQYVEAARGLGASHKRLMFRHILPQCVAPYLILATTHLGVAIVIEASLGFLGVGIPPPSPTWGNMLSDALNAGLVPPWWLVLFPGVAITITVLAFNLLGDGIRDLLDPRLRGSV